ncbi:methyltransferase [Methylosinus sp. R-45379]|jgi:precorrin-6B methylase 2|uniref:methyltransferase n=1 Tax=Methylosinus sp. R-45379 TaxID=980563 RepID=UPI0007C92E15|nr:methyltransferase [Methylosinus sp. R-45379]OAI30184.1 methyltransferase [Methylosinus sp. R-45379]
MSQLSPEKILGLGFAFWNSKVLLSAVELGLFTVLAEGPADAETLRARLGLHQRSARDFFDALVALGMLERENGLYRNTAETDLFLDRAKPSYVGQILEMSNLRLFSSWNRLTDALRTGAAQSENAAEGDFFGALYADPQKLRGFLTAMSGISAGPAQAIAAKFPWKDYASFVDVGCAQGMVPVTVARAHPHLTGGGFDLPQVQPVFDDFVAQNGLSDRLRFYPGDFFKDELPKVDVIVMGHILHDWNLEEKRLLLAKAYEALPKGGALIVYEALIDDERKTNAFGLLMSLNMLIETPGGFDYTGADCQGWMREAGFFETRVEHLLGPDSMVVGVK